MYEACTLRAGKRAGETGVDGKRARGEEDQMAVLPQTGAGDPREGYCPPRSTGPTRPSAWANKQLQKKVWRT